VAPQEPVERHNTRSTELAIPANVRASLVLLVASCASHMVWGSDACATLYCPACRDFAVMDNQLSGTIPSVLMSIEALTDLYLSRNVLIGTVPVVVSSLSNLRCGRVCVHPHLFRTTLYGLFRDGMLHRNLFLGGNMLNGSLPAGVSLMTRLTCVVVGIREQRLSCHSQRVCVSCACVQARGVLQQLFFRSNASLSVNDDESHVRLSTCPLLRVCEC
jgi:hypothetical protein